MNVIGRQQAEIVSPLNKVISKYEIQVAIIHIWTNDVMQMFEYNQAAIRFMMIMDLIDDNLSTRAWPCHL